MWTRLLLTLWLFLLLRLGDTLHRQEKTTSLLNLIKTHRKVQPIVIYKRSNYSSLLYKKLYNQKKYSSGRFGEGRNVSYKIRHSRKSFKNKVNLKTGGHSKRNWTLVEQNVIKKLRCKRYHNEYRSGYYIPSRCYNYCECGYYHPSCARCYYQYVPEPTYVKPHVVFTCNCHPEGSLFNTCNSNGACMCKPNYKGPKCKRCKNGYWKDGQRGCVACNCDENGSENPECNLENGQCKCKPGVGGKTCNSCLPKYYGNITEGCKECDPCTSKGHICDPVSGKCVCPPFTHGENCDKCTVNSWGFVPSKGCKNCSCSVTGSTKLQCNKDGICDCKEGFTGEKCDSCSFGFFGYPECRKCQCDQFGTLETEFVGSIVGCAKDGSCICKENVEGTTCKKCKQGSFGLSPTNSLGCTKCFCFGRSNSCSPSTFTWDRIRTEKLIISNDDCSLFPPPCINLPSKFTGDLTLSYGGLLSIITQSTDLPSIFTLRLMGNNVTLEASFKEEITFDEKNFNVLRFSDNFPRNCWDNEFNRECFMVVLQNVSHISLVGQSMEIMEEILLDKAIDSVSSSKTAKTVENCECPIGYTSLSCQNPSKGFFRDKPNINDINSTWIDTIIGLSRKCDCNGLSDECDQNSGYCKNCEQSTDGPHCEYCAEGHYKSANGGCQPCLCPSEERKFAKSCSIAPKLNQFICYCKEGYTGKKCNACENGYFGSPEKINGFCEKCNCNPYGSKGVTCEKETGQCDCHMGFTGRQCSLCQTERTYIKDGICTPCDKCTQILFNQIDELSDSLNDTITSIEHGVQGPWRYLDSIKNRHSNLKTKFSYTLNNIKNFQNNMENIIKMEDKTNNMYSELRVKLNKISNQEETIKHLADESGILRDNLTKVENKLENFIKSMNTFGRSHVDIKNSLEQGKGILREMDYIIKFIDNIEQKTKIFEKCYRLVQEVKIAFKKNDLNIQNIIKAVEDLKMRFEDMINMANFIKKESKHIKRKNKDNFIKLNDLTNIVESLSNRNKIIENDLEESLKKLNISVKFLTNINKNLNKLEDNELGNLLETLRKKEIHYENNEPIIKDFLNKVEERSNYLKSIVEDLKSQLSFTKEEWQKINAGESYENIINGIAEAENNLKQANTTFKEAFDIINPINNDAILIQSSLSLGLSDRLEQRIRIHLHQNDLRKRCDSLKYQLNNLETGMFKNGRDNNNFNTLLHGMKEQMQANKPEVLKEAIEQSSQISRDMNKIIEKTNNILYVNEHNLIRPYYKYKNETSKENVRKLNEEIYMNINRIHGITINNNLNDILERKHEDLTASFERLNDIKNKILALKANLTYATQRVNNLFLPMSLASCSRWYQLKNIGVFNSLKIKFNCTSYCNLINISTKDQSINLKVNDGNLMIKWSDYILNVKIKKQAANVIEIKRKHNELFVTAHSKIYIIPNQPLLYISDNDLINVGGYINENEMNVGCINEFFINDATVGLWNFVKSSGTCTACETETNTTPEYIKLNTLYKEGGYTMYNVSTLNPQHFSVTFNFQTFDENSLLFLAQEIVNPCAFIALTLKNGKLEFFMRHNDNTTIVPISVPTKLNNGQEQNVNIALEYKNGKQIYELTVNNQHFGTSKNLLRMNVFRIKQSRYYIGGLSPKHNKSCIQVNTTSFVGFLNHISERNLRSIATFNTFPKNKHDIAFDRAWFIGDGILKINSTTKFKKKSFTLYFEMRSILNNSFVMNIEKIGKLIIKNQRLTLHFINGEIILSSAILNDILNMVNITIKETESLLVVNGNESIGKGLKLTKGDPIIIEIGEDISKEYFGFLGGISNIYVDNRNVDFNSTTIMSLHHVEIGRWRMPIMEEEGPTSLTAFENSDNMQNTQGCFPITSYRTDPDAIKFGDKSPSYVYQQHLFWKKNYTLEMEFRTLYPNGLLLLSTNFQGKKMQYAVLEIKRGQVQLTVKGKRKPITTAFETKVDNGKWHHILINQEIIKKKRKLKISVDGEMKKILKMPKSNVRNEYYLGGIPFNYTTLKDMNIQQFRGCIKSFKINDIPQLNTKDLNQYMNLGSCFPKIEKGAYFGGDAYALYKQNFQVNKQIELSFEFKTSEHNGIILSVSTSTGSPALSVELQNGGMVMTVDAGNSPASTVINNLDSDYALCNNKWHNVTALYSLYELTINIDGIRKSWVRNVDANSLMDEIEAPLYVGGVPDSSPAGTLKVRENFKGCIRKLKIDEVIMDWTDMEFLNNVLLDSCPVIE